MEENVFWEGNEREEEKKGKGAFISFNCPTAQWSVDLPLGQPLSIATRSHYCPVGDSVGLYEDRIAVLLITLGIQQKEAYGVFLSLPGLFHWSNAIKAWPRCCLCQDCLPFQNLKMFSHMHKPTSVVASPSLFSVQVFASLPANLETFRVRDVKAQLAKPHLFIFWIHT